MNIETIIIAAIAIFVVWRLWSVLGTRTGAERPPMDAAPVGRVGGDVVDFRRPQAASPAPDRWKGIAEPGGNLARGLDAIASGDPSFDAQQFLGGARGAYEMITKAFADGDIEALRGLLAPEPFANFSRAIETRRAAGQKMLVTLVSIDRVEIVDAAAPNGVAQVAVKFAAKMSSATTDAAGAVVDGSITAVAEHVEVWTFARPFASRDPNWLLMTTEATH